MFNNYKRYSYIWYLISLLSDIIINLNRVPSIINFIICILYYLKSFFDQLDDTCCRCRPEISVYSFYTNFIVLC